MEPLNKHILPTNYKVHFDLEEGNSFAGHETITLNIKAPVSTILLNGKHLDIRRASLEVEGKMTPIPNGNISYSDDIITIKLAEEIPAGTVALELAFAGKYGQVTGLYRSNYKDTFMYTTQFEAAHAREAFPCIDEPTAKATFDISVTLTDGKKEAISNGKVIKKEEKDGRTTFTFDTSPKMSTYLLYLGAGELEWLEEEYQGKKIRIITTPRKAKKYGGFAMEAVKKFLTFYENYFGIKYPLDKLDLIAVPDFGSGAMENWGAITFREDALLYDPKESSLSAKQRVAEVISHELVHQWFGNLVTMRWWNDLWLNESFADYMAYKAVAHHYPEMDPWADFLNHRVSGAYVLDALNHSHPINVNVKSPVEIREIFDAISYSKGGMVLRMLEAYIGEEIFRKGLHSYLTQYSYNNAEGNDLWENIAKFTDKPVENIMANWLNQMGFPLVEVKTENSKIILSQKRFTYLDDNDNKLWLIPIALDTDYLLLDQPRIEIPKAEWIKINKGEKGFYRVKYSPEFFTEIKKSLAKLDCEDIWGLYNDCFALCLSLKMELNDFIDLINIYSGSDYIVVDEVLGDLGKLDFLLESKGIKKASEAFCSRILEKLGWEKVAGEKERDGTLRSAVIHRLGRLENQEVLSRIKEMFAAFLKDPTVVDPDLKSTIYKLTAWQGDETTYETLLKLYEQTENPQEQVQLLASLACFKDVRLLKRSLELALSKKVRHQNIIYLVGVMCTNPFGKELVWPWIKENWDQIKGIFSHYVWHFNSILGYLSLRADTDLGKEIKDFLEKDPIPGTQRALAQMLEKMEIYKRFLAGSKEKQTS